MLTLELLVLAFACAAALVGIWTQPQLNETTAVISTALTVLGFVAAAALAVRKSVEAKKQEALAEERRNREAEAAERTRQEDARSAEQRRQHDLRALLATMDLTELEISWSFESVPPEVRLVLLAGELITDTNLLASEDIDRLPQAGRQLAIDAWHLENTVQPLLVAIADGVAGVRKLYKGEKIEQAAERYRARRDEWVDDIGTDLKYVGRRYQLVFPLNPQLNAALRLGHRPDDVRNKKPDALQEDTPFFFKSANYGFRAEVTEQDHAISITWQYDRASLGRAVARDGDTKLTAALASHFNFVIIRGSLDRRDYLQKLSSVFREPPAQRTQSSTHWADTSRLDVYVNGLKDPHYVFDVTRLGTFEYVTDQGAYEEPQREFAYVRFGCAIRHLQ